MSHRATARERFEREVGDAFAFLGKDVGFVGPAAVRNGLGFHGADLHVEVWFLEGREPGVDTQVQRTDLHGGTQTAWLGCLYVAAGLGSPQRVTGSAPTTQAMVKRVREHAVALHRLLPALRGPHVEDLFARCARRASLPSDWRN